MANSNVTRSSKYVSKYETTRFIARLVSFIGWFAAVVSMVSLGLIIIRLSGGSRFSFESLWILLSAVGGFVIGLFLVISGQLTRAVVDNTDYSGEMLFLLKEERSLRNDTSQESQHEFAVGEMSDKLQVVCLKCKWTGSKDEFISHDDKPNKFIYCPSCDGRSFEPV